MEEDNKIIGRVISIRHVDDVEPPVIKPKNVNSDGYIIVDGQQKFFINPRQIVLTEGETGEFILTNELVTHRQMQNNEILSHYLDIYELVGKVE